MIANKCFSGEELILNSSHVIVIKDGEGVLSIRDQDKKNCQLKIKEGELFLTGTQKYQCKLKAYGDIQVMQLSIKAICDEEDFDVIQKAFEKYLATFKNESDSIHIGEGVSRKYKKKDRLLAQEPIIIKGLKKIKTDQNKIKVYNDDDLYLCIKGEDIRLEEKVEIKTFSWISEGVNINQLIEKKVDEQIEESLEKVKREEGQKNKFIDLFVKNINKKALSQSINVDSVYKKDISWNVEKGNALYTSFAQITSEKNIEVQRENVNKNTFSVEKMMKICQEEGVDCFVYEVKGLKDKEKLDGVIGFDKQTREAVVKRKNKLFFWQKNKVQYEDFFIDIFNPKRKESKVSIITEYLSEFKKQILIVILLFIYEPLYYIGAIILAKYHFEVTEYNLSNIEEMTSYLIIVLVVISLMLTQYRKVNKIKILSYHIKEKIMITTLKYFVSKSIVFFNTYTTKEIVDAIKVVEEKVEPFVKQQMSFIGSLLGWGVLVIGVYFIMPKFLWAMIVVTIFLITCITIKYWRLKEDAYDEREVPILNCFFEKIHRIHLSVLHGWINKKISEYILIFLRKNKDLLNPVKLVQSKFILYFALLFIVVSMHIHQNYLVLERSDIFLMISIIIVMVKYIKEILKDGEESIKSRKEIINKTKILFKEETHIVRKTLNKIKGEVVLKDIHFKYKNRLRGVFEGLSLKIEAGEKVCIKAAPGKGKTTIAKLITQQMSPDQGQILIDRYPINKVNSSGISLLDIQTKLSVGSLFFNIIGLKKGAYTKINKVLEQSTFIEDLDRFPMGLSTIVHNKTAVVSLSEKMKILLARVFCKDPKVLLIDNIFDVFNEDTIETVTWNLCQTEGTVIFLTNNEIVASHVDRVITL